MRKGILLLNGEPYTGEIDTHGHLVYCCDGAYTWAKGKVRITQNVGDFDSLLEVPVPIPKRVYPKEKALTDAEIALHDLFEEEVDEVEIYGGYGGREDHFIGNLQLLYACAQRNIKCTMISENTFAFVGSGKVELGEFCGLTFSVFPFSAPVHIIGSEGCKYSYPDEIGFGECRGISNVVKSDDAFVRIKEGDYALIFVNRGEV